MESVSKRGFRTKPYTISYLGMYCYIVFILLVLIIAKEISNQCEGV